MDMSLIGRFNQQWNEVLERYGVEVLHMRDVGTERSNQVERMLCDLLNAVNQFAADLLYLRTCCIVIADYNAAKQIRASMKTPEELCVDFCLGGLSISAEDIGLSGTVSVKFDQNEPFQRWMDRVWRRARKNPRAGWPRQVQSIEKASPVGHPGMQLADMFAWALNRHQTRKDEPLLFSASFMSIRHSACRWSGDPDFAPRLGSLLFT